jgi:hypothetical protein
LEYPAHNIKTEGYLDWSHLAYKLPSTTCYLKKDIEKDKSERKMRKEM